VELKAKKLVLSDSLKNGWRIVSASRGNGKEIEAIQCHLKWNKEGCAENDAFTVVFTSYRFDGKNWHSKSAERNGFWEGPDDWPDRKEFP
jgi:hypothetical protein